MSVDLKSMSDEELVHHELRLERKLVEASFRLRLNQLTNTSTLGGLRKDIARARTAQRERELANNLAKDALRNKYRGSFKASAPAPSSEASASQKSGGFLQGVANQLGLGGSEG
jgi:large subunit ribosomal protein L29